MDSIRKRIEETNRRYGEVKDAGLYFYLQPLDALDGAWVSCNGRRMLNFASYSYLGLLGHPWIDRAGREAIERYGTGTHGVRILAGTLPLHTELEQTIARFKKTEDAIVYTSGYVTNLTTVSTLVGRNDLVICDKLNHASIVDGCLLSGAQFVRFCHNDMADLERRLLQADPDKVKLCRRSAACAAPTMRC
ncbi:MAG: aminotransferase class I/II-fold pyridoxal phosphate-dependent enzyme [Desulfobacterales bacterium]|nr:aminotransferase class I/II-fold pyridoxal phosphate-dependent enzyme [Desulfobacterales bacterium]